MSKLLAILKELGEAMKIPKEKLDAVLNDDAGNPLTEDQVDTSALGKLLKEGHTEGLSTVSKNLTFDKKKTEEEAYKKAERKFKTDIENIIKDKFDLTDSPADKIEELIEEAAAKIAADPGTGKKGEITESEIKKHPAYVKLEQTYKKQIDELKQAHTEEVTKIQTTYKKEKAFETTSSKALQLFESMKPVLSPDAGKAAKQRELAIKLLAEYEYEEVEGQIIISKDGEIVVDERHEKLSLEEHVKNVVSPYFDFQVADPKQAPNGANGGKQTGGGSGSQGMKYTGPLPKNKQEVSTMVLDQNIPLENRMEIQKWADEQGDKLPAA